MVRQRAGRTSLLMLHFFADMAETVDAPARGAGGRLAHEVREASRPTGTPKAWAKPRARERESIPLSAPIYRGVVGT